MKLRHRFSGLVLLLAMGLALGAAPARALTPVKEAPVLSRAWEWLIRSWDEARSLSHLWGKQGLGADPNGKPGTVATTTAGGGLLFLQGDQGLGADPDGGH